GGDGFCTASGTSFATPFVAGTVALMRQGNATLNNTETKRFLMQEAQPWGPNLYSYPQPRNYDYGAGRIQAYNATAAATGHPGAPIANPRNLSRTNSLDALHPSKTYSAAPDDRVYWIAATLIVPTTGEGGSSMLATLTIQPHGSTSGCKSGRYCDNGRL
ncbi:MAG: S8 family serine peptidase, partial [Halobacteriales archaeon]|nr:S8 family serine peptidase [Halobacteriales archaeon]